MATAAPTTRSHSRVVGIFGCGGSLSRSEAFMANPGDDGIVTVATPRQGAALPDRKALHPISAAVSTLAVLGADRRGDNRHILLAAGAHGRLRHAMTHAGRPSVDPSTSVDYVALPAGRMVGRYEIVSVLGQGGFGITYRARDRHLDREVALKEFLLAALAVRRDGSSVLPRSTEAAGDFGWGRGRFMEEGRTLASLPEAPSIVKVFDFLEANGTAYIVMELVRGRTLQDYVSTEGPLAPAALEAMLWPLLAGLQKVHEAGFLHRDIKPANIMLDGAGKATLIDFGASRAAMADRTGTMTAIFTPGYAAPEQFAVARQGPWTDIYGLAATLHYAVTGTAPPSAVDRLMKDAYQPLAVRQPPGILRNLAAGIDAALSIHADERPQSIAEWRALLRQRAPPDEVTLVMPRRPLVPKPPVAPVGGKAKWLAIGTACVLLGAGGFYLAAALQPATGPPSSNDGQRAQQEAEAGRQRAETAAEQLEANVARREAEARRKAEAEAARARQAAAADAQAKREAAEQSKIDEEAKARAVRPPSSAFDGTYRGSFSETGGGGGRILSVTLSLVGTSLSGQAIYQRCGTIPVSLTVTSSGEIGGAVRLPDMWTCAPVDGTASGRVSSQGIQLELRGPGMAARGMLTRSGQPLAASAPAPTPAGTAGTFEGAYSGSLSSSAPSSQPWGLRPLGADLRVSQGRLTGQLVHPTCGATSISLPVDAAGAVSGTVRLHEANSCTMNDAAASGRVTANALTLDIQGISVRAHGTLSRRAD
ncbi:MAG: protein kinase [Rhodospirillales bacterium]|nr:protein kinase [Rhodospirillales bacterium]